MLVGWLCNYSYYRYLPFVECLFCPKHSTYILFISSSEQFPEVCAVIISILLERLGLVEIEIYS